MPNLISYNPLYIQFTDFAKVEKPCNCALPILKRLSVQSLRDSRNSYPAITPYFMRG